MFQVILPLATFILFQICIFMTAISLYQLEMVLYFMPQQFYLSFQPPPQENSSKPEVHPFLGLISKCYEAHLGIYIQSQDRFGTL